MGFFPQKPLFEPGSLLISCGVINSGLDYQRFIRRHLSGDWGDTSDYDAGENRRAVDTGEAVVSQYNVSLPDGRSSILCIMTETKSIHTVVFFINESLASHELE